MSEREHTSEGVGILRVKPGDVLKRSEEVSGDRDLDSLLQEILVVTQIPEGRRRVIAEVSIGIRFPQGNKFSIPEIRLISDYFHKLEPGS